MAGKYQSCDLKKEENWAPERKNKMYETGENNSNKTLGKTSKFKHVWDEW